jgi:hypothetical protein
VPGWLRKREKTATEPSTEDKAVLAEEKLRQQLHEGLKRAVSTPNEPFRKKLTEKATNNPQLLLAAATVGVGIATVLTGGTVHLALMAAAGTGLVSKDSPAVDWLKSKRNGTVHLDSDAVYYLLGLPEETWQMPGDSQPSRLETVKRALSMMPPGNVSLTVEHLREARSSIMRKEAMRQGFAALRTPIARVGLALFAAGLFLIAATIIPEYVRAPTLRAAVAISAIGAILIVTALFDSIKTLWASATGR